MPDRLAVRAVLFDLGNTLVHYYTSAEFPDVLRRCLRECAAALDLPEDAARERETLQRALLLNKDQPDHAVRPLAERLESLFGPDRNWADLVEAFLRPIFAMAQPDPAARPVLHALRERGIKTAVVSNTPWGSPADVWRQELRRHSLLEQVDAAVFCMDVGWRKPHQAPFARALSLLNVAPEEALFVGDDPGWDVAGAQAAGLRPVLLGAPSAEGPPDCLTIRELGDVLAMVRAAGSRA